ncbi:MAG: beta-ketoacyl-ACP synthase II [bacterium]
MEDPTIPKNNRHRVAITGLGVVSPIGIGRDNFWQGLVSGKNGVGLITHFDHTDFTSHLAAEVGDFDPEVWIDKKTSRRMDRFAQFAVAAATMAMEDSELASYNFDKERTGVIIGSGIGGSQTIGEGSVGLYENGPKALTPFFVPKLLINMAASMVSIRFGLKGPISALSVACSTGANAIGDAFRIIQRGDADIMLAGSSEAAITPLAFGGFCATRSMTTSTNPDNGCRPFDKERDGFVMGEGAGIIILENMEHALKRNAPVYAELTGYGNTAEAYHYTAPDPTGQGMIRCMKRSLDDAGIESDQVDYINAHGTSTVLNDKTESFAIAQLFGEHAQKLKINSIKSMIGHLLAAAGSVEFISTILSIKNGMIPPTIHFRTRDPECPLDYVTGKAVVSEVDVALSNSFGFGGGNVSLIAQKYRESDDYS